MSTSCLWKTGGDHRFHEARRSLVDWAVDHLELRLQRSKDADLHVTLQPRWILDYRQPFLRVLVPHKHRCASISAPYHILVNTPIDWQNERLRNVHIDHSQDTIKVRQSGPPYVVSTPVLTSDEIAEQEYTL